MIATARIAAVFRSFNLIRQMAPIMTSMVVPWAQVNLPSKE